MKFNLDCKLIRGRCFNNNIKMGLFEIGGDLNSKDKIVGGENSND